LQIITDPSRWAKKYPSVHGREHDRGLNEEGSLHAVASPISIIIAVRVSCSWTSWRRLDYSKERTVVCSAAAELPDLQLS
jgi:hypothetical protein